MTSPRIGAERLNGETRLSVALVAAFVPTYAATLYLQAGPLVVGIVAGSMVAGFAIWLRTTPRRPPAVPAALSAYFLPPFLLPLHAAVVRVVVFLRPHPAVAPHLPLGAQLVQGVQLR